MRCNVCISQQERPNYKHTAQYSHVIEDQIGPPETINHQILAMDAHLDSLSHVVVGHVDVANVRSATQTLGDGAGVDGAVLLAHVVDHLPVLVGDRQGAYRSHAIVFDHGLVNAVEILAQSQYIGERFLGLRLITGQRAKLARR